MKYFDEAHETRWFSCGWTPRQEGARVMASRLRSLAAKFEAVEPILGRLWPQLKARPLRASDPGPLLAMADEELADLIDRRARFDPPAFPAPVGPGGYSLPLSSGRKGGDGVAFGGSVHFDSLKYKLQEPVLFELGNESPVWQSAEMARGLLFALVEALGAQWAAAITMAHLGMREDGEGISERRPWMCWAASGHPIPSDWTLDVGAPIDVRQEHGGQTSIWPWPPVYDRP